MSANEFSQDLAELIEQLLDESYAVQAAFSDYNLEKVGKLLEEAREGFESGDERSPEGLTEKASFEKCVEIYCNILMALESLQKPMSEETLGELSGRQQRTQLFAIPKEKNIPQPPPLFNRAAMRPPVPPAPPITERLAPKPEPEFVEAVEEEKAPFEDPLEGFPVESEIEEVAALPMNEEVEEPITAPGDDKDIWSVAPEAPAQVEEGLPEMSFTPVEEEEAPKTIFEDEAPAAPVTILEEEASGEEPLTADWDEKTRIAPAPIVAPTVNHVLPPAPTALISNLAQEYWHQADHFRTALKRGTWPLSQAQLLKLIGQSLVFSLESECGERLDMVLKHFWSKREAAIRTLLDSGNRKFELHPALKKAIDHAAEEHTEWLLEGKFPHAAVLSSLRYISATLEPDKFQPSLLEAGVFVFFFGQDQTAEKYPLQNLMGASGFDFHQATEFLFRLSRLHRLKNKFLSATGNLELGQLLILEQDFDSVVKLLEVLQLDVNKLAA